MTKVGIFVNVDSFFVSHRLPMGLALRDAGMDVVVFAADTGASTTIREHGLRFVGIPIERSGRSPPRELRTLAALASAYRRERVDVVQHASVKALMYGSWVARGLGIPVINTVSGLGYAMIERPNDTLQQRALRAGVKLGYRFAFHGAHVHNVFQNPEQLEQFVALGLTDRASTLLVRGSGVDVVRFQPSPLPEGTPIVMVPSRLLWDKGIGEFVEAVRSLRAKGVIARYVLVGGTDEGNPARIPTAIVEGWVTEGVVEWWGHQHDMPGALAQATLVVLPSYAEGMPLALAEGAACGRPIIASDIPGCREVVIDGFNGWRVKVRDPGALAAAIEAALGDRARLREMGARSRDHVVEWLARERVVREMLGLYRRVLGDKFPQ